MKATIRRPDPIPQPPTVVMVEMTEEEARVLVTLGLHASAIGRYLANEHCGVCSEDGARDALRSLHEAIINVL